MQSRQTVCADPFPAPACDFLSFPPSPQGQEDKVVPPNQAELMHQALKERGIPTALVMFEGEQHGFRQAPNIRRACCCMPHVALRLPMPPRLLTRHRPCQSCPPDPAQRCRRALDGELYFYGVALGFSPPMPDDFEPLDIANAPQ